MLLRPAVVHYDPMFTRHFKGSTQDIQSGDLVVLEGEYAALMDSVSESNIFLGIAGGKECNNIVPVFMRCCVNINLVSADYAFGAGLKYSARETLTADGGANTIAHYFGDTKIFQPTEEVIWGRAIIDVPSLCAYNNNWDVVSE